MVESQAVLEWMAQAQAKTLLRLLKKKFPPGPPPEMAATILACRDAPKLEVWLDAVIDAGSLDEFRRAMQ